MAGLVRDTLNFLKFEAQNVSVPACTRPLQQGHKALTESLPPLLLCVCLL